MTRRRRPAAHASRGLGVLLALVASGATTGATWRVYPDAGGGTPTIAAALAAAAHGDTVLLACGVYFEHDLNVKSGITLASETGRPECVTIDAQGAGRVIRTAGVDSTTALVGLTLTGGRSVYGGGLWCGSGAAPRIAECAIVANSAAEGGGVWSFHALPVFTRCTFAGNEADYFGGGLACYDNASARVDTCAFTGNRAGVGGGGARAYFYASPVFTGCTFAGNVADSSGGAIEGFGGVALVADGCIVWNNCAPEGAGISLPDAASAVRFSCSDVDTAEGWRSGAGPVTWAGVNLSADPRFCDPPACPDAPSTRGGVTLALGSPCDPSGNACGIRVGAAPVACTARPRTPPGLPPATLLARPNPFRATMSLEVELPVASTVEARVFAADGRLVRVLAKGAARRPGTHRMAWDGRDAEGGAVGDGVYFVRVIAGDRSMTRRVVRLR